MARAVRILQLNVLGIVLSTGCTKTTTDRSTPGVWKSFRGIEVHVPEGTDTKENDGVLPGPGGLGGIPSGVRPTMDVSLAGPQGFYLQIVKPQAAETIEGEVGALTNNHVGSAFARTTTKDGWELTYEMASPSGAPPHGKAHAIYRTIAGGHYKCEWAEINCPDPAAAEAVCRSMRPER